MQNIKFRIHFFQGFSMLILQRKIIIISKQVLEISQLKNLIFYIKFSYLSEELFFFAHDTEKTYLIGCVVHSDNFDEYHRLFLEAQNLPRSARFSCFVSNHNPVVVVDRYLHIVTV
jgi:hypothetical protein